jgi:hypothetical protein
MNFKGIEMKLGVISHYLLGMAYGSHKKLQSGQPMSWDRYEPNTSRM